MTAPKEIPLLDQAERERPTLKTIARLSALSVPTVSRALSDAPDINENTKKRVRALADELGYRPNRAGVRLRTGKTNVIALVLSTDHDVMNHTARLINAVASELRETPYHVIVTPYFPDESPLDPVKYIVTTGSADGVILNRIQPDDPRVAYLRERDFPFAMHGRTADCRNDPYYDYDNRAYGRIGCETLIERKRRHVVMVAPPLDQSYAQHMIEGMTTAAQEAGITAKVLEDANSDCPSELITQGLGAYLDKNPQTDAVLCASAPSAVASSIALEARGYKIGRDVDLLAKEAIPFLKAFRSAMLVFNENVGEAGGFLARALINSIDNPGSPALQRLEAPVSFSTE